MLASLYRLAELNSLY